MLLFLYIGVRAGKIGEATMMDTKCPVCEAQDSMIQSTFGRYVHSFWIPLFPVGRKHIAECSNCKTSFERKEFEHFMNNAYEYSMPFEEARRPWWHWLGISLISGLIVLSVVMGAIGYTLFGDELDRQENDPRAIALKADLALVEKHALPQSDSLTLLVKSCVDGYDSPEWKEEFIHYLVKRNQQKTLILLDYDHAKNIDARDRHYILKRISTCLDTLRSVDPDSVFYGLHGKWNMLATMSPYGESLGGRFASDSLLFPFYDGLVEESDSLKTHAQ